MQCKCKQKLVTEFGAGVMVFSFPDEYLKTALIEILKQSGVGFDEEHGLLIVQTKEFEKDLQQLVSDAKLNDFEISNINLAFIDSVEKLDFSILSKTKSVQTWLNMVDSQEIAKIIDNKSLTTYFQPIIDVRESQIYGYEALSRGVDDTGKIIPPNIIFSKAKKSDYLFGLDRAAREISLKTAAVKNVSGYVFINFIPTSIYNPENCLKNTLSWAKQLELDFSKIVFEVVETEKVDDLSHLKSILDFYKKNGFKVALDDVGAGYSNLSTLVELKPDIVKIDRALIQDIEQDSMKQSIFFAIKDICDKNGITKLAEGVETKGEVQFLKEHVDLMQGYYFAKPSSEVVRSLNIDL
ncbi:MAG: EAL domain-containing protein [Campylobacterota bacterium]